MPTPGWWPRSARRCRARLAAVPHPLRREPDVGDAEDRLAVGQGDAALDLRPARRRGGPRPVRPRRRDAQREASHGRRAPRERPRRHPRLHRLPAGDLAPDLVQQPRTSDSTARSAAAPTSSGSSPTAPHSSASSAPSWPNSTTNGSKAAATSASTSSPAPAHHWPTRPATPKKTRP